MRVFLIGVGPLPFYVTDRGLGAAHGTWQACVSLLRAGHTVFLVTGEHRCFSQPRIEYQIEPSRFGKLSHYPVPETNQENLEQVLQQVQEILQHVQPDCIVSAGSPIASRITVELQTSLPVWFDLFGEMMCEVQCRDRVSNDKVMPFALDIMKRILARGDRFSAVSGRQRLVVVGQLSMLGRLNAANAALGTKLVHTMPAGIDTEDSFVHDHIVLRGRVTPRDAFIVLWSGGFNHWVDLETLFSGVDEALQRNSDIHFVCTGGPMPGHSESAYAQFADLVKHSRVQERYHLLGWVAQKLVHNYFLESDLGINVDLDLFESEVGSRTRVLPWFKAALPPLMTCATELSAQVQEESLGFTVPIGQPRELARALLECARNRAEVRRRGLRAQRFAYEHLGFSNVTAPLLEWVNCPTRAPDHTLSPPPVSRVELRPLDLPRAPLGKPADLPETLVQERQRPWWRRWF